MKSLLLIVALAGSSLSCGGYGSSCKLTGITVNPAAATADHTSAAPGNSVQFFAAQTVSGSCPAITAIALQPDWSVSDSTDVTISSAKDTTNGTATCLTKAPSPVTVSASVKPGTSQQSYSATATLTCN